MIYLDYAATTPMSEKAIDTYSEVARKVYGNSSSLHDVGENAKQLLDTSRIIIAQIINGDQSGVYFTRGGSDGNILCLLSLLNGLPPGKKHIISSKLEHSSIRNFLKLLEEQGYKITYLNPNKHGKITVNILEEAINEQTGLATIQHGNSEIGTIQNIKELGSLLKSKNILFHSDCVQTFCKIPIHVREWDIDAISVSAHKVYGPKGVGAVYINPKTTWQPVIPGTTHENGFVPGTVNTPGIMSFTVASYETYLDREQLQVIKDVRDYCLMKLKQINGVNVIHEDLENQLPHIIGCTIQGIEGQYVMLACNRYGIAISTGTACQIGMQEPSETLLSLGKSVDEALQYIRISFGTHTTKKQIDTFIDTLHRIIESFPNRKEVYYE